MKGLLIIDVQNVMFTEEGGVWNGDAVVENIGLLLERARRKFAPVVYIQHNTGSDGLLALGSDAWRIDRRIKPRDGEPVVAKTSWDSFLDTELESVLRNAGITRLVIAGMQTEFCVDTTVRRAYSAGYRDNIVASDGHTTFNSSVLSGSRIVDHHNSIWEGRFAGLMKADEIEF